MKKILSIAATVALTLSFSGCIDSSDVVESVYGSTGACVSESTYSYGLTTETRVVIINDYPESICDGLSGYDTYSSNKSCSDFPNADSCSEYDYDTYGGIQ